MAELLRDNPYLVAGLVMMLAAIFALRTRFRRGANTDEQSVGRRRPGHPGRAEDESHAAADRRDREREGRRVRWQMGLALFAILGFTLIAIVNSF